MEMKISARIVFFCVFDYILIYNTVQNVVLWSFYEIVSRPSGHLRQLPTSIICLMTQNNLHVVVLGTADSYWD